MYSTIQRTSSLFLSPQLRLFSASEQRCLVSLLQKTYLSPPRCQSSAAAAAAFKNGDKNQGEILSSSSPPSDHQTRQGGAKGRPLPPNMVFRYCSPTLACEITNEETLEVPQVAAIASRPLVLLFAWMFSRNSSLEKYRKFWISRGYDILTVQTSPIDALLPFIGGKKNASNVFNFLSNISPQYDQVLVHAFSVGGYQFCELLQRLNEGLDAGEEDAERVYSSIKGIIVDSAIFADDAAQAQSRGITEHPIGQPLLEMSLAAYFKLTKPFVFDRYKSLESVFLENRRSIPSMMLFSKDDVVSNWRTNLAAVDGWKAKGIEAEATCWETSKHILHFREHPAEYEAAVDAFIKKMDITKAYR